MTDLVARLRSAADTMNANELRPHLVPELCTEAAAEIERLRAKIEAISQVAGKASIEGVTFAQIKGRDSEVLGKFTGETHGE